MESVAPPTKSQPGSPIIIENRIHILVIPYHHSSHQPSLTLVVQHLMKLFHGCLLPYRHSSHQPSLRLRVQNPMKEIPSFSHSIPSIFPPESSESNERIPPFSHSIPSIFPPESSESNERLITRSSHSIPSIFQPNKSDTASSDSVHKYSPSLSEVSNVVSSRPNTSIYVPDEFKDLHLSLSIDGNKSGSHKIVKSIARIAPCSTFKRKRTNTKVCLFTLIFVDFPL
jgi:hypothetical protein